MSLQPPDDEEWRTAAAWRAAAVIFRDLALISALAVGLVLLLHRGL